MIVKSKLLATTALCALSLLMVAAGPSSAQGVGSFQASLLGLGWLFQTNASSGSLSAGGWTDQFLSHTGLNPITGEVTGYYMVGFNQADGAPPAFIQLGEDVAGIGTKNQVLSVTGVGAVYLVDKTGYFTSSPVTDSGDTLYHGALGSATQSLADWYSQKHTNSAGNVDFFGYRDNDTSDNPGELFKTGVPFLGRNTGVAGVPSDPTFGVFNFGSWAAVGSEPVYLGMDVMLGNGKTMRIYVTDTNRHITPEPAFYQMAAFLSLGGLGLLKLRRRRK